MKDRVVCVKESKWDGPSNVPDPIKGEIYTILGPSKSCPNAILLVEFGPDYFYATKHFRPVDDTYGPAICETIEQQIELEKVLI